jgi:Toprim-like
METTIQSYLDQKSVFNYKTSKEIVAHCIFNNCDKDSRWKEAHLYIEEPTWLYHCKKCGSKGNWITLLKHFWDSIRDYPIEWYEKYQKPQTNTYVQKRKLIKEEDIRRYHKKLPLEMREWLNKRWVNDEYIDKKMLWYGSFFGSNWITIPIRDKSWNPLFFKLRRDPRTEGNRYAYFPSWYGVLYGEEVLENPINEVFICEGEFDKILVEQGGLHSITSTSGASTFKDEWIERLEKVNRVYIAFDNDETWKKEAQRRIEHISLRFPQKEVYNVNLPLGMGKDITDFIMNWGTAEELKTHHSEKVSGVDLSKFTQIGCTDIIETLSSVIKYDDINKLIVFLGMLSAYTEDSQLNIMMNAQSSSGKSYIPLEISNLFPEDSVVKLHYVSPSAFFHEEARYDEDLWKNVVNLDRKILIFIDQQRSELLERLRPLLSHDQKLLESKIVDKSSSGGNMTKTIFIKWYPGVIFCTTLSKLDEQEATRFILLSPEIHQEKINDSITLKIRKESSPESSNSEEENIKSQRANREYKKS